MKETDLLAVLWFLKGVGVGGLISAPLGAKWACKPDCGSDSFFLKFFLFCVREATFLLPSLLARCCAIVPPSPWQRALQRQRAPAERASARVSMCERCARVCVFRQLGGGRDE